MKSDQELKIFFKVFLDKQGILNVVFLGETRESEDSIRQTELMEEAVLEIFDKDSPKKYNILVDLLIFTSLDVNIPVRTRKILTRLSNHKQVAKVAYVGGSVLIKTVAGFILRAAGKSKIMKWFSSKEEAVSWLQK